jgi:hypothetical protein
MNDTTGGVKGLVIRESLRGGDLPRGLAAFVTDSYRYSLGGDQEVEILVVGLEERAVAEASFLLAEALVPRGYYAHFVRADRLWVVFPNSVVIVRRGDADAIGWCRTLGRACGVPDDQMPFEALFEKDHPNAH